MTEARSCSNYKLGPLTKPSAPVAKDWFEEPRYLRLARVALAVGARLRRVQAVVLALLLREHSDSRLYRDRPIEDRLRCRCRLPWLAEVFLDALLLRVREHSAQRRMLKRVLPKLLGLP